MTPSRVHIPLSNAEIAQRLAAISDMLEAQDANPFRVRAYLRASRTVQRMSIQAHELLEHEGIEALVRIPGIGVSLARTIQDLAFTGRVAILDHLEGSANWEATFASVVGIGHGLARRIHEELGIETLTELEVAAHDGRLANVPGIGSRRLRGVQEALASRLRFRSRPTRNTTASPAPPVAELLDVDEEYRRRAENHTLPKITPRRFNPTDAAWLPILHTRRGDRHYTALYSNTAHAHETGMTHDWVVIHRDDREGDGLWTVVTSRFGKLKGSRIVRGREAECGELHQAQERNKDRL